MSAAQAAEFTPLGDLDGGGFFSRATDVSADGSVVVGFGASASGAEAFRWTSAGMVGLGDLPGGGFTDFESRATDVSATGNVIVGWSWSSSGIEAFRWTSGTGMVGLGDLPGSAFESQAHGVSSDGSVVVGGGIGASGSEAFRWTSGTGLVGLGDLPGGDFWSGARGLSDDGSVVVGFSGSTSGFEAARWTSATGMVGLGDLAGGEFSSRAHDVSADGSVVVGWSASASGREAYRWTSGTGMVGLGDLPGGSFESEANGVSADGSVVVGTGISASSSPESEAFVWTPDNGMQSLRDVLVGNGATGLEGWALESAEGISADGQWVVGTGKNPSGLTEAFLANISVELGAVLLDLSALTDVNGNGTADVATLVAGLEGGSTVYVNDGASGDAITEIAILDDDWRAIDMAVTPGGAGAVIGVLAQKYDGSIAVAVHRARDGALVREIPYFGPRSEPSGLAYVPNATGPGNSAFAVIAKNIDDGRVSVQLKKRSDGSLINTNRFFLTGWDPIELDTIDDVSGNGRPELVVLARSEAGLNQVVLRDAETKLNVNKINYFGPSTTPKAMAVLGDIGGGPAPELAVLGELPDGRYSAQNRDALTDERITSVAFFNASWTTVGIERLADVNGNSSPDLAVLAQHDTTHAIKAQVRDGSTGALIRTVNFLGTTWSARALAVFPDLDGNGVQELGVAAREEDGDIRVQLRDAATGAVVRTIDLP